MKATVTRIFTLTDKQIDEFMSDRGYSKDEELYTEDDVENELDNADAYELEDYGDCNYICGHDIKIESEK